MSYDDSSDSENYETRMQTQYKSIGNIEVIYKSTLSLKKCCENTNRNIEPEIFGCVIGLSTRYYFMCECGNNIEIILYCTYTDKKLCEL